MDRVAPDTRAPGAQNVRPSVPPSLRFDDAAPPDVDEFCMLCFNISNRAGLKIIADSRTDAILLIYGFAILRDPTRSLRQPDFGELPRAADPRLVHLLS